MRRNRRRNRAGALVTDALLLYTLTFDRAASEALVGDNGPWAWQVSNDQGAAVAAPVVGTVSVLFTPVGGVAAAPVSPVSLLVDAAGLQAVHRVGVRYPLTAAGTYRLTLSVTMATARLRWTGKRWL